MGPKKHNSGRSSLKKIKLNFNDMYRWFICFILCVYAFSCTYVCAICVCLCLWKPEEGIRIPRAGVICGNWTLVLQEQQVLLTAEPPLYPFIFPIFDHVWHLNTAILHVYSLLLCLCEHNLWHKQVKVSVGEEDWIWLMGLEGSRPSHQGKHSAGVCSADLERAWQ